MSNCLLSRAAALIAAACLFATVVHAQEAAPKLRWGADKGGGAPFVFDGPEGKLTGFETALADYLARKLGRTAEFVQKEWDGLPQDLQRGDVDIILNGYEWSAERDEAMLPTVPYYIARLRLLARVNDDSIRGWDDLRLKPGRGKRKVGVLKDSAGHRFVEERYKDEVDIVALGEEGTTGVMRSVVNGNLDATVQDTPTAGFYAGPGREFPELRSVGEDVAPAYFVIYCRQADVALRDSLSALIREGLRDGTLARIYGAYGLWNEEQQHLILSTEWPPTGWPPRPEVAAESGSPVSAPDWSRFVHDLLRAAWTTVQLTLVSMPLAMVVGLGVAVGRLYGPFWLRAPLAAYVEVLRGTPLLLQLFAIYYLLPEVGIKLLPFWAGILGLAVNYSAYEAENYRAGLLAIPKGQMEAALALGMSRGAALRYVIVPQAVRLVIPPVTNDFIALFKDTSVCAVIAVTELTGQYRHLVVSHPRWVVYLALLTGMLYLLMSYPLSLVAQRLESRLQSS